MEVGGTRWNSVEVVGSIPHASGSAAAATAATTTTDLSVVVLVLAARVARDRRQVRVGAVEERALDVIDERVLAGPETARTQVHVAQPGRGRRGGHRICAGREGEEPESQRARVDRAHGGSGLVVAPWVALGRSSAAEREDERRCNEGVTI